MFNGLRNLRNIAGVVLNRSELYTRLFTVEAKIEMALLLRRLAWAVLGVVFSLFALAMIHLAVLSYFWFSDVRTLAIMALLFVDLSIAGSGFFIANKLGEQESFKISKEQLAKDIEFVKESV